MSDESFKQTPESLVRLVRGFNPFQEECLSNRCKYGKESFIFVLPSRNPTEPRVPHTKGRGPDVE